MNWVARSKSVGEGLDPPLTYRCLSNWILRKSSLLCHPERNEMESRDLRTDDRFCVNLVRRSFDSLCSLRMTNLGLSGTFRQFHSVRLREGQDPPLRYKKPPTFVGGFLIMYLISAVPRALPWPCARSRRGWGAGGRRSRIRAGSGRGYWGRGGRRQSRCSRR